MRQTGKMDAWLQSMKKIIENNQTVGVAGCKDPTDILNRLSCMGVEAKAEVMEKRQPTELIFDENSEPIGLEFGKKVQTGFIFSKKPTHERI